MVDMQCALHPTGMTRTYVEPASLEGEKVAVKSVAGRGRGSGPGGSAFQFTLELNLFPEGE